MLGDLHSTRAGIGQHGVVGINVSIVHQAQPCRASALEDSVGLDPEKPKCNQLGRIL